MTARTEHTAEPWHWLPGVTYLSIQGDRAERVLLDIEPERDRARKEADYARMVACVNACAGMADPAAEIDALRAERDALRAVCERALAIEESVTRGQETELRDGYLNQLRAALARGRT